METITDFLIKAGIPIAMSLATTIVFCKYKIATLEKNTTQLNKDVDGLGSKMNKQEVKIARIEERLSDCTNDTDGIYSKLNKNTEKITEVKTAVEYLKNGKSKSL